MSFTLPIILDEKFSSNKFFLLSLTLVSIILYKWVIAKELVPPAPPKLPIIGHLHHLIGKLSHRSLASLSHKYGDLMLLYLGNRPTLVVSSATAAEDIIKTHDLIFANRPTLRFTDRVFYDGNNEDFGPYGEKWIYMKSISKMQLLSNKRVRSYRPIREEEVGEFIKGIRGNKGSAFNLSESFLMLSKGLICRIALGMKCNGNDKISNDFYYLFKELLEVMGEASYGDYVPYLGWVIDQITGIEGRVENIRDQFYNFIEDVIQEHEQRLFNANQETSSGTEDEGQRVKDFVDYLLQIQREEPEKLPRQNIKTLILGNFIAGIEGASTTLEWAMTELLRHPKIMKELQEEVRSVVKLTTKTKLTEDDLENMKYLKAVIKETLRLHPPSPLLAFHESSENVKIREYDIRARTQVIINAWAIQRDPNFWKDPNDFNPNRFIQDSQIVDFRGQHLQYIPFGAGRRGCPGISYGIVSVELTLASLLYEFNWTLPNDPKQGNTLDVEERPGVAVGRRNPLRVIATPKIPSIHAN